MFTGASLSQRSSVQTLSPSTQVTQGRQRCPSERLVVWAWETSVHREAGEPTCILAPPRSKPCAPPASLRTNSDSLPCLRDLCTLPPARALTAAPTHTGGLLPPCTADARGPAGPQVSPAMSGAGWTPVVLVFVSPLPSVPHVCLCRRGWPSSQRRPCSTLFGALPTT